MKLSIAFAFLVTATTAASAAGILPYLTTEVNPFGVPDVGTGIAISVVNNDIEALTALNWHVTGAIVNHDTTADPNALFDPPRVQSRTEAEFADVADAANAAAPFTINDSYWGAHFTGYVVEDGYQGSGDANPTGTNPPGSSMALELGTTFTFAAQTELLLYLVITEPVLIVEGELAVGPFILESFDGLHAIDLQGNIYSVPEPASFTLLGAALLAFAFRRRR